MRGLHVLQLALGKCILFLPKGHPVPHVKWFILVTVWTAASGALADDQRYPRPDLLIETSDLAKSEVRAQYVVLDAREMAKFAKERVPGARWVDHTSWAKSFRGDEDAEGWAKRIGTLGVDARTKVVVYDDALSRDAARIWWLLRFWGVDDVRLLNGDWGAWKREGRPIETGAASSPTAKPFVAKPRRTRLTTKKELLGELEKPGLQIVDARSAGEHCGLLKLSNRRAGAVPGAKPLEWSDLLDKKSGRFKCAAELHRLFTEAGIALDKPSVTYCQSGGRAAVMAFGLELMGADRVSNYYASWAEWGNADDTPVVPGRPRPND